jgi:hypothetical protein
VPADDTTSSKSGLIDKMFNITGEAFLKFGNFLRGDSSLSTDHRKSLIMSEPQKNIVSQNSI